MRKNHSYEVNHLTNTVTVTKAFLESASQIETREFQLYRQFQDMGFNIVLKTRSSRKKDNSPLRSLNKPAEDKQPLLTFLMMAKYIALLDDAEVMMDEFDAVRRAAKSQQHPRQYVNDWFRREFPHYDDVPEFDEENHIVHNPNVA